MASHSTLIAGGGIAGLAAALGLARLGRDTVVCEQASAFEEVGAGLQLGPNAVRALQWLGAWDAVEPSCFAPAEIQIRDGHSGKLLQRMALGSSFEARFGSPYRVVHRADLLHGLLAAAKQSKRIILRTNSYVMRFEDAPASVEIALASGECITGSHLIGADGIHSRVRQQLRADGPPLYRGQTIYRTLIEGTAISPAIESKAVCLWLCKDGHVVHYPVCGGGKLNIVAAIDRHWVSERWDKIDDGQALKETFGRTVAPLASLLTAKFTWRKWAAADRAATPVWTKGRVTLIGDAAHAALPYLAQGAAMALEDAVVLARCIDMPQTFAALRQTRTAHVQALSRQLGRLYHLRGAARLARNFTMSFAPPLLGRLTWLYGYDPTQN